MSETFGGLFYLIATTLFIFGVKNLGKVRTARRGNALASLGMLIGVITTLLVYAGIDWTLVVIGLLLGGAVGAWLARTVAMTAMPEMVGLFNGFGGLASLLVAMSVFWGEYLVLETDLPAARVLALGGPLGSTIWTYAVLLSVLVGGVTLSGSLVAVGKLSGKIKGVPNLRVLRLIGIGSALLALYFAYLGGFSSVGTSAAMWMLFLSLAAFSLGASLVLPIGGADMPVVVSLLNSYSGIAASMAGFVVNNSLLITAGALVGASGLILTNLMCKAMNRSLLNVLIGGFGGETGTAEKSEYQNVKSASAEEAAMVLESASSVIFVPGYGMAVAQAQHVVKELGDELEKRGATVRYAIHPVAGRMPGHMNVLLAESDVPYEKLFELDAINSDFKNTDVAVVVGANDVVNPAAIEDPKSLIAGMPILMVHDSGSVLVVKRSLSPGYAGIKNPLFERDNTLMCFGDGKAFLTEVLKELKES